jgi:hypothetical protein
MQDVCLERRIWEERRTTEMERDRVEERKGREEVERGEEGEEVVWIRESEAGWLASGLFPHDYSDDAEETPECWLGTHLLLWNLR